MTMHDEADKARNPPDDKPGGDALRPLQRVLLEQWQAMVDYADHSLPSPLRGLVSPEDVAHDAFVEALRREADFDPGRDPTGRGWLFTIVKRRLIYLWDRRIASRQLTALAGGDDDDHIGNLLEGSALYERTPSASAISHEAWAAVKAAMGRLSSDQVEVIRSRHYDRESSADFGARTGRSERAVNQLYYRAIRSLRLHLWEWMSRA